MKWPARAVALSLFLFLSLVMAQWAAAANCVSSLSYTSKTVDYTAHTGSNSVKVTVYASSDCFWPPSGYPSWIKPCSV